MENIINKVSEVKGSAYIFHGSLTLRYLNLTKYSALAFDGKIHHTDIGLLEDN